MARLLPLPIILGIAMMKTKSCPTRRSISFTRIALLALAVALLLAGCGRRPRAEPTPTPTPTAMPATPTVAPVPDAADEEEPTAAAAEAAAELSPITVIPPDYRPVTDGPRGYGLALPPGWTQIDLRSEQFRTMVGRVGMEGQLQPLFEFLETPAGEAVGIVAATNLAGMIFGGLPTILNVSIVDAGGMTPDDVAGLVTGWLEQNGAMVGDVTVERIETTPVNGLPAVQAEAVADLSAMGVGTPLYLKAVGLLYEERLYLLTLVTEAGERDEKAEEFAAIIGTFGPQVFE
jgi:hypothetical protein